MDLGESLEFRCVMLAGINHVSDLSVSLRDRASVELCNSLWVGISNIKFNIVLKIDAAFDF